MTVPALEPVDFLNPRPHFVVEERHSLLDMKEMSRHCPRQWTPIYMTRKRHWATLSSSLIGWKVTAVRTDFRNKAGLCVEMWREKGLWFLRSQKRYLQWARETRIPLSPVGQSPATLVHTGTAIAVLTSGKLLPWEIIATLHLPLALDHILSPCIDRFHPVQQMKS